jgi:uncharacterized protein (TIGR00661 family)
MKILIATMSAVAETSGPFSRTKSLAKELLDHGYEVALCAANDVNYRSIQGVKNYGSAVPVPFGLPEFIGKHTFQIAQKLGFIKRKTVHSFEEVLYMTGATAYPFFKEDVIFIREVIREFKPDFVYSEFRLASIIAAKLESVPVFTSYSYPVQPSYAKDEKLAKGVNKALKYFEMNGANSTLDIFDMADLKIIPSSFELEPVSGEKIVFTGPFQRNKQEQFIENDKNIILAYMGIGTISQKILVKELEKAFLKSSYQVYIAGWGLPDEIKDNIHKGTHFNFRELLPKTAVFINHGGQNSIMDALYYGVPQIICPGKVFERKYNAESVACKKAAVTLQVKDFNADTIKQSVKMISSDKQYAQNAKELGNSLTLLGGADEIIKRIESWGK